MGLIDPAALDRLDQLDPDGRALRQVIALFLEDAPRQVAALEEAVRDGDASAAGRSMHQLRGACSLVGATGLDDLCLLVEQKVAGGALEPEYVRQVQDTLDRVLTELVAELGRRLPGRPAGLD